jgi:PAS domain S-box-containing protein
LNRTYRFSTAQHPEGMIMALLPTDAAATSSARGLVDQPWDGIARQALQHYACLVLDVYGCIEFCNRAVARLFGCEPTEAVGQPIHSFVFDLPFNESTPGYNLAVSIVWYSDGWRSLHARARDGRTTNVEARISEVRDTDGHSLLMELRWLSLDRRVVPVLESQASMPRTPVVRA